jgi:hypothetical protein
MPDKRPRVKNEKQYESLERKGMSKQRVPGLPTLPVHRALGREDWVG